MQPGTISDLVKSQFGYHIIKVVDKKAATTRPLDEVRAQIADQMAYERAQEQATQIANTLAKQIKTGGDLDAAAASQGLEGAGVRLLLARRADHEHRSGAEHHRARVHAGNQRGRRSDARRARSGVLHHGRQRAVTPARRWPR